jgi:hypothetical protein
MHAFTSLIIAMSFLDASMWDTKNLEIFWLETSLPSTKDDTQDRDLENLVG